MSEFLDEFVKFQGILGHKNKNVTFFGSARLPMSSPYCKQAKELAFMLNEAGLAVLTGGGDGIMRAANMGAYESAKAPSIAFNIRLPFEQKTNPFITNSFVFSSFTPRKFALINYSIAFVVFPGGFGTLDELFDILALTQTKLQKAKIFLVGSIFWAGLDNFIKTTLIDEKLISKDDVNLYHITDDIGFIASEILKI
ncbi:hypothetical protein CR66_04815 [Campylobacter mucosalis]|uniref:Cytokinin riboside 5'-monophosphate phosphoribohydrolase n=1 Tax=Campylobacter mucosalis CCUG 21559 TaxID=1032067 RepID=A0A6G5QFE2_9BACT|nr:TIGR00730 family Rossman fold protein [Campylobacter mucosalis]KEA46088.1 hypothetical protein CR66_04815 [Campylobacter mucosalis]QCD44319.1 putative lysine decarboxylase family protein [Campylobacter mucosalis CCUG 21559]QKF63487.1 putative lysine decarboxylase family protein [Campylobacter mucosalis]